MNAFLDGQESRFASLLSSASTEQIHELNRHLLAVVGNLRQRPEAQAVRLSCATAKCNEPTPTHLPGWHSLQNALAHCGEAGASGRADRTPDETGMSSPPPEGDWSVLSSSDLAALKVQIDQQLNTVRTEFQAFLGPLTSDMLSAAAVELDSLPVLALIAGAKNNTSRLMALLSAQQDSESSLVDDVLFSMTHLMDSESLVTADDPVEALMEALQLEALQKRALLDLVTADANGHARRAPAPPAARSGPQSYDDAQSSNERTGAGRPEAPENPEAMLVDQVWSIAPVINIDHAGHFSLLTVPHPDSGPPGTLPGKGLLTPLPTRTGPNTGNPGAVVNFEKPA